MKQKRAPGAGRPPGKLGLKSATLSLRLPEDMRRELAAAAIKNKRRSVSEEIVLRLRATLDREEADLPRHVRSMSQVVARIALALEQRTKLPWNRDRYTQQQLSKAIDFFLYTYSRGEIAVPPAVAAEAARHPDDTFYAERLGETVAGGIIAFLKSIPDQRSVRLDHSTVHEWWKPWQLEQDLTGRQK
jgi:hypothetical protein